MKIIRRMILLSLFLMLAGSCKPQNDRNTLTLAIEKGVTNFDPRISTDSAAERIRQLLFNGLTRKRSDFTATPDLATSFTVSSNYRVHTFKLRDGVKFHNGQKLSSTDIKYTFDTMLEKSFSSQKKVELSQILQSIEIPDAQTVTFTCKVPCPGLPNMIIPIGIIPTGSSPKQSKHPIGTGPFAFAHNADEQEVTLNAFPDYFEGRPHIDHLRIKIIPDSSTRESELRKGSIDLAINADIDPITIIALKQMPDLKVEIKEGSTITHLGLNLLDPVLKDRQIRQALAYGIDRETIIRDILQDQARSATSILPINQWAYEPNVITYTYDPARAIELLNEANKPRLKLSLKTSSLSISRKIGEAMQEHLRKINIEIDLQPLERQKLTQDIIDGNFQLYLNTLVGGNQSTDIFKYLYSSQSIPPNGQNRSRYINPLIDRLIDESTLAPAKYQLSLFSQIQRVLAEDLPQIYLWYPSTIVISRNRVIDLELDPSGDWRALRNARLKQ